MVAATGTTHMRSVKWQTALKANVCRRINAGR